MNSKKLFAVLFLVVLAAGCVAHKAELTKHELNVTPSVVFGKNLVKYAKNFKLIPFTSRNCKGYILKTRDGKNWDVYVLYNGTKPVIESLSNPVYIRIPVRRLVVMSSTHIAMLEAINATNCIAGYMYTGNYKIYFPDVVKKLREGKIVELGSPYNPDYEKIIELHPDLVVIYVAGNSKVAEKLRELHIPFVIDSEWKETSPLGRVEWVKFFGAITGKEKAAEAYFERIVKNVTEIKDELRNASRPTLAWAIVYNGKVYMPTNNTYVANMVRIAGCRYLCANESPTDIATLLKVASNADYFIYGSYFAKNLTYIRKVDPRLTELKAFKEFKIYNISPDYWQLGYLHTDRVIEDLAAITHPELFRNYTPHFFIRLK